MREKDIFLNDLKSAESEALRLLSIQNKLKEENKEILANMDSKIADRQLTLANIEDRIAIITSTSSGVIDSLNQEIEQMANLSRVLSKEIDLKYAVLSEVDKQQDSIIESKTTKLEVLEKKITELQSIKERSSELVDDLFCRRNTLIDDINTLSDKSKERSSELNTYSGEIEKLKNEVEASKVYLDRAAEVKRDLEQWEKDLRNQALDKAVMPPDYTPRVWRSQPKEHQE